MKLRCDYGNGSFVMAGCQKPRERLVTRVYEDLVVKSQECDEHADVMGPNVFIGHSVPLKPAA